MPAGAVIAALFLAGAAAGPAMAGDLAASFNETMIETVRDSADFDINDVMGTFGQIFGALDDEVNVYPTENYYYFTFYWGGVKFAGNMRLDAADRDDGVLHFAYFVKPKAWNEELLTNYKELTSADGVVVEKVKPLVYKVTYKDKSVVFHLNDLSDVKPPDGVVRENETYLGPVFDESGTPFYLLFDRKRKDFLFVLDERKTLNDILMRVHEDHPALTVGVRTGFAYYQDRFAPRKILIGVYEGNVDLNNYYDGPFDQLPDNFMKGTELRDAILAKYPDLEGQIDRLGGFNSQEGRFLVNPYTNYEYRAQLDGFLRCGDEALDEDAFYRCLMPSEEQ